jgi:hypothetical protein
MSMAPFEFPQGVGWVVTDQAPDQVAFPTPGNPVQGVNITFLTAEGNSGVVFIDYGTYRNTRKVHAAIEAQARLVDQVANLTSASFK